MRGTGIAGPPVTAGCRTDIERLLEMYKEKKSLRYAPFFDVFKQLDFHTIFWGKFCVAELVEFSEKLLQMAIAYAMVSRESVEPIGSAEEEELEHGEGRKDELSVGYKNELTLQERLFGIYLTYTLYVTQPFRYVAQVRISLQQLHDLEVLLTDQLIPEKHFDAISIMQYFGERHIFRIVAFEKDFDVLMHRRYDRFVMEDDEGTGQEEKDRSEQDDYALLSKIQSEQVSAQVDTIHKWYLEMKALAGVGDLNMVKSLSEIYDEVVRFSERRDDHSVGHSRRVSDYYKYLEQGTNIFRGLQSCRRSELKAKAFKARAESARSKRFAHARSEMKECEESTDGAGTSRNWDQSYSVNMNELMREVAEQNVESNKESIVKLSSDEGEKQKKRKKLMSPSEMDKAFETSTAGTTAERNTLEATSSSTKTPRNSKKAKVAEKQANKEAFVLLPLGDGTGQPTKTRLPDEAIKAAVNIGKSKEERKGDAILKKLGSKEGATVS
ncbi:snRNA-activating protein complex subunit 1 [Toxocara canis]|uniref:snRNA-activating protein complex subunit 1 n=1 Tax=Toxocara canis TaxID=6265 RepID=A0A0B2VBF6_TOXCA|nr:snRNA-activating protein complex subunit 1 [Toxocara canis]